MIDSIRKRLTELSELGVRDQGYYIRRRIVLSNQICLIAFVIIFMAFMQNFVLIQKDMLVGTILIFLNFFAMLFVLFSLYLNSKEKYYMAKCFFMFMVFAHVWVTCYCLGREIGHQLMLANVAPVSMMLFNKSEKRTVIVLIISAMASYVGIHYLFPPGAELFEMDAIAANIRFAVGSVGIMSVLFFSVWVFDREINRSEDLLWNEYNRSEKLLLNILPKPVAERLKESNDIIADGFSEVSVLFADIVGFTAMSAEISPKKLVSILNEIFSEFDKLANKYGLEKIKTIGDAYMLAAGIPVEQKDHAKRLALAALDMQKSIKNLSLEGGKKLQIRIGIHTGSAVAGVIGQNKFSYDVWGDTVNTASRMESHGEASKIHVSKDTYEIIKNEFNFESRGVIPVKGKGEMETYFLTSVKDC